MKKQLDFLKIGLLMLLTIQNVCAQWQITSGPTAPNVVGLCSNGTNLFSAAGGAVGTSNGMVALSNNNGTNWNIVNNGLSGQITCLASKINDVFAGSNNGVFQTSNNGTNWTNTSTGLPAYPTNCLFVNGNDIYAGTFGVYRSTNNGLLWSKLSLTWNATVNSIAVNGNTIIAGTTSNGIYLSTNAGSTWTTINTGLPLQVNAVTIYSTTLLAGTNTGLYISTNNGASWSITNITNAINCFTSIGGNIFAGSSNGGGVFQSTNGGSLWLGINTGLTNTTVFSLSYNNTYLFTGTNGYVFRRLLSDMISTTGINESKNIPVFSVYPNPFNMTTTVLFETEQEHTAIKIYDLLGKEIRSFDFSGNTFVFNKDNMNAGIYFIKMVDKNNNKYTSKIVLQ